MRDIKKPEFMKAAIQSRSHNAILEIIIAMILFLIGDILISLLQVPALVVYLLGNKEYLHMIVTNSVDINQMLDLMQKMPDWITIVSLLSEGGLIAVFILYCRLFEKRRANTMGFSCKKMIRRYLSGILMGATAFLAAYAICLLTGSVSLLTDSAGSVSIWYLLGFLLGYLVQGMAEEVLCHGYLMVSLSRRYSVSVSVVISAIFFSMLHGMNNGISFLAYINLFLFGIFAALLFIRCESIWVVGAVHGIWNYLQGNIFGVQVSGMKVQPSLFSTKFVEGRGIINGGSFGMEGGLAVTVALLAANGLILWNMSRKGYFVKEEPVDNRFDREYQQQREAYIRRKLEEQYGSQNPWQSPNGSDSQNNTWQSPDGNGPQNNTWQSPNGNEPQNNTWQSPKGSEQQNNAWQNPSDSRSQEKQQTEHENMGLNPEETPWHPEKPKKEEKEITEFNQSYFKD